MCVTVWSRDKWPFNRMLKRTTKNGCTCQQMVLPLGQRAHDSFMLFATTVSLNCATHATSICFRCHIDSAQSWKYHRRHVRVRLFLQMMIWHTSNIVLEMLMLLICSILSLISEKYHISHKPYSTHAMHRHPYVGLQSECHSHERLATNDQRHIWEYRSASPPLIFPIRYRMAHILCRVL